MFYVFPHYGVRSYALCGCGTYWAQTRTFKLLGMSKDNRLSDVVTPRELGQLSSQTAYAQRILRIKV